MLGAVDSVGTFGSSLRSYEIARFSTDRLGQVKVPQIFHQILKPVTQEASCCLTDKFSDSEKIWFEPHLPQPDCRKL